MKTKLALLISVIAVSGIAFAAPVLWDWNYCSDTNKCNAGEGDCDRDSHCNTGYCAQNVGTKYGQISMMDVCEESGTPVTTIPTTTTIATTTTVPPTPSVYFSDKLGLQEYAKNFNGTKTDFIATMKNVCNSGYSTSPLPTFRGTTAKNMYFYSYTYSHSRYDRETLSCRTMVYYNGGMKVSSSAWYVAFKASKINYEYMTANYFIPSVLVTSALFPLN